MRRGKDETRNKAEIQADETRTELKYIGSTNVTVCRHSMTALPTHPTILVNLRSITWAEKRRKESGGIIEWREMLSHPPFAQKAAQFMLKTGLLLGRPSCIAGVPPPQDHIVEDTCRPRRCLHEPCGLGGDCKCI